MAQSKLRALCEADTGLGEEDIAALLRIEAEMPLFARLIGADLFLDCFSADGVRCVVAAEALQAEGSLYSGTVVGKLATKDNEPAVFSAMATGMSVRDVLAVTQELRSVRQVAVPVKNPGGRVIAVLIQEKDVSESVAKDKKYARLQEIAEDQRRLLYRMDPGQTGVYTGPAPEDRLVLREVHHRIKNNLQLVASILNLQARASSVPEVQKTFRETVSRIRSIAAAYDLLSADEPGQAVPLPPLLRKVCHNVAACSGCAERGIAVAVRGDDVQANSERATVIALVVNELVMNAVEHAFGETGGGNVAVTVEAGQEYARIAVQDDGAGFDAGCTRPSGLGLSFVESMVAEKLGGALHRESGPGGTCFSFDFRQQPF